MIKLLIPILVLNFIPPGHTNSNTQCQIWCNFSPAVQTPVGCLCGTEMDGLDRGPFDAFMGIPFAKPPVGRLRFSNPVPSDPWKGYLNASAPKPICIQKYDFYLGATVQGQEDCMYLNVYRPRSVRGKSLPVMVFIHGGSYLGLSAHPSLYGPEKFMDNQKVILVTVQYRLGAFGFLSTDDWSAPGNFGLKDQSLALRWVQRNIGGFGGNPRKVTIFGHGAGAASVQFHLMSPLSEGLFAKAISLSGSALSYWNEAYLDQLGLARRLADAVGVDGGENMSSRQLISALQKVDAIRLVNSVDKLKIWYNHPIILFRPVVEKYVDEETFLAEDPKVLWDKGHFQKVPWMTGYLPNEGIAMVQTIYTNSTLLQQFLADQKNLIPLLTGIPPKPVFDRYFDGTPISPGTAFGLTQVITEAGFIYPMMMSIHQHLRKVPQSEAPVSLYFFNFKSSLSCSVLTPLLANPFNSGACHSEELMYLFRQYPYFPNYSPEAAMSRLLVKEFVNFAYKGRLTLSRKKCKQSGQQFGLIEFTNSGGPSGAKAIHRGQTHETMTSLWEVLWWNQLLREEYQLSDQ